MLSILAAGILMGCAPKDPIERLVARLHVEAKTTTFTSYPFQPINLPATASPEQLIAALSTRGDFKKEQFESVKIVEIREVQIPFDVESRRSHTAVLLDTTAEQKIVLFQPMNRGWYFKIYDSE